MTKLWGAQWGELVSGEKGEELPRLGTLVGKPGSCCPRALPLARGSARRESGMECGVLTPTYDSYTPSPSPLHCLRPGAL